MKSCSQRKSHMTSQIVSVIESGSEGASALEHLKRLLKYYALCFASYMLGKEC